MHNANTPFTMSIPEDEWEETGPNEDPRERLQTHIRINGLDMHLEAIQVKEKILHGVISQAPKALDYETAFDHLVEFAGSAPFETIIIGKRKYCLFATPYCT
ncbi:MAG: hypothetical protein ACYC69_00310 [Thermodesulfovibrionales bacterium]